MSEAIALLPVISGSGSTGVSFIAAISYSSFSFYAPATVANWSITSSYSNWTFAFIQMSVSSTTGNGNYLCDPYAGLQVAFNGATTPADSITVYHTSSTSYKYTATLQFVGSPNNIIVKIVSYDLGIQVYVNAGAIYLLG